ncbi:hypothetical protein CHLNCDRAFT_57191 [Chlorella variabilis]|uniref:Flavodoxin-like domain-containing protein n=1 Tax=Chlorella variabilis TaxID=554065 RepID=E1Z8N8_CHLVA|nr:hypothetical protein CHLNCDRAFT_57191 [Chlorella variabilis]EFN57640.1 hypothetical protein CHLNCDRAFT_57191 [Chlorella variabilis]|eukprot:XP_005849742.1 hypothetical protein CHLNCDRAFT_57191 [Chlorella variabilis]
MAERLAAMAPPETKYAADIAVLPVSKRVDVVRVSCSDRLPEVEYNQRHGTTTNAYLLKSGAGACEALIDVPSKVFDVDFAGQLQAAGAAASLRHIIITRLTPERLPVLARVLEAARKEGLQLLLSNPALQLLNERAAADEGLAAALRGVRVEPLNRGSEVQLEGAAAALRFVPIPTPRWPDLVAVYSEDDNILFSSNFFSAHTSLAGAGAAADGGGWDAYAADWRNYFDCMLAPVARQVATALDRLNINAMRSPEAAGGLAQVLAPLRRLTALVHELTLGADDGVAEPLAVAAVAPMHGPVVRQCLTELVGRYADWTAAQVEAAGQAAVAVLYASAYGNTASLAQAISRGITKAGVGVETLNLEQAGQDELEAALDRCSGFVLGSPTLGGHMPTQVQTALGTILRNNNAKRVPCSVFGSFGWSGEAVDKMEQRLKDAGFRFVFDPVRCKFKPTQQTLQLCEESGLDMAQEIKRAQKRRDRVAADKLSVAEMASGKALALGRVVGSLCVVTAKDGDAQGAMLASWVSQASFDPPGLTIAVKRDRAMESMLPIGASFNLNILAEGKERAVMKQLLKPFKPAEDRLAGMEVEVAEGTGAAIIPTAAAYVECTVASRMEAGDHYVVYASVSNGKVLDAAAQSAVHYRRISTTY